MQNLSFCENLGFEGSNSHDGWHVHWDPGTQHGLENGTPHCTDAIPSEWEQCTSTSFLTVASTGTDSALAY